MDHTAMRTAIDDLHHAFLAELEGLPAAAWQQPSDCDGWTIAAAVIHVVQVAHLLGGSLARGRAGDAGPPPLAAKEGVAAWRAARQARQQEALTQSPAELIAWYRREVDRLDAELDAIPSADPDARGWHPIGAQPLAWIRDQWLFELALHDWDIRVALDPTAEVRPMAQAAFGRTLPGRLARGFGAADDPAVAGVYRIDLESEAPFTFTVRVGGGVLAAISDAGIQPDTTIRSDPSAFGLVVTSRRPVDRFEGAGRWQIAGDTARAAAFARGFTSY